MKKIAIAILAASTLFVSCSKELDQTPSASLSTKESVTSVQLLETAVRGVYAELVSRWGYSGDVALYADAKGGDLYAPNVSANHFLPVLLFQTDRNSGISEGAYEIFSTVAARANSIIEIMDIPAAEREASAAKVNDALGQLYALRALAQFEMVRLYSKLPVVATDVDAANSGMPIYDRVFGVDHKFSRATIRQSYTQIIADFEKALTLLSKDKKTASGQINYWAAAALLSRVHLYNGDYDKAYKYASEVIDGGAYSLYERDAYLGVWSKTGTDESIFEVLNTDKSSAQRNSLGYYTSPNGYPEAAAATEFMTWAKTLTGDIRLAAITERATEKGAYKAFYTTKYQGQEGATSPLYVNNYKVVRLSEMYLIAAEALLRGATQTGTKAAVDYYNDLRSKRIEGYTVAAAVTLDDILAERRIEFFCEGHRLFDMMRFHKSITSQVTNQTYEYTSPLLQIEIPQREIDIAQGALVQNPS